MSIASIAAAAGSQGLARTPAPSEARLFRGSLSHSEWTFRGKRNRIFLLVSGAGRLQLGKREVALVGPAIVWAPAGEPGLIRFEAGVEGASLAVPDIALGSAMPTGAVFATPKTLVRIVGVSDATTAPAPMNTV